MKMADGVRKRTPRCCSRTWRPEAASLAGRSPSTKFLGLRLRYETALRGVEVATLAHIDPKESNDVLQLVCRWSMDDIHRGGSPIELIEP